MCGRTAQGLAPAQIRQELDKTLPSKPADSWIGEDKYRTSYNVAPTRYQPVVRADPKTNSYVVHLMRWGLIPRNTKSMPDYSSVLKSINARDDSLSMGPTGKPMFSHSKNQKRCILLAEGFYEWRRRGKERVPFFTKRRDGKLMLMAAIYDVAQIQGYEEPLYTYATITTRASPQLDWLHDRMPVLIPNDGLEKIRMWLDPNLPWNSTLEAMLKPCDEFIQIEDANGNGGAQSIYVLETYQVDEKVNSVKNDSPDFAKPWNSSSNEKTLNRFLVPKTALGDAPPEHISSTKIAKQESEPENNQQTGKLEQKENISQRNDSMKQEEIEGEQVRSENQNKAIDAPQGALNLNKMSDQDIVESMKSEDLKLALELSRQEEEKNGNQQVADKNLWSKSDPRERQASKHREPSESVDLLERRRIELQQEEEEMKKVLEMSRLQAIADGHEDTEWHDSIYPECNDPLQDLDKLEDDELKKAIAASLNETDNAIEPLQPQQPAATSRSIESATSPSPRSKIAGTTSSPTTPRKRKPGSGANTPVSPVKSKKRGQDAKITHFFHQATS